ncbi:unnamed protein product [Rotaria magnacalcarata]|uniref:PLAT domain-containing protein n=1 Tax=Rotaria magnacalcarata TaxID=392030 RepID=A0A818WPK6_9BILA|nr:unnamed protein product [Rotaria magnacalcarata]CAF3735437.1 unnamed protein product [Rotaria magnacalcarata]
MASVASNTTDTTSKPLMDQLTHAIIKETSKNLKYYIDVKRRENAFVLNPKSPFSDSTAVKAKLPNRSTKEHLSLYGSYYADKDTTNVLPSFQQKQTQFHPITTSPEKRMCREELNFHMRSYNFSPRESSKFSEIRAKPTMRLSSSCGIHRDCRPRTSLKLTRHEQDQLVDDAADILASLVKSRRSTNETNTLIQPTPALYISQPTTSSPRQTDDQSNIRSPMTYPATDLRIFSIKPKAKAKGEKRIIQDAPTKATSMASIPCEYKISVTTGNCNGASTNAPIRIRLHGTNGHTNFHELVQSETHRIPFLKNQSDVFTLQTFHVGELVGITVGHDRKDMQASWFLSKISISDPIRHKTSNILCNAWLSIKSIDQKTMRDFQVASVVSHQKTMISNDHREENESQSDYSTRTIEGTVRSNETNLSENILLTDYKPIQKNRKQQHVSIGPTTIAKRLSSMSTHTNNYSQLSPPPPPPLATIATIESHFNHDDLLLPPIVPRIHSAALSETSSDTEIESNMTNRTRSTSRTPSPTFHQTRLQPVSEYDTLQTKSTSSMFKRHSIDHDRPPARLEKRVSPLSVSVERPDKNNENNPFSFIE